ncbi:hypothetical protein [Paraprevotella xylaniphila]|uniref:hypothetical protein n=2 Tax=Paraprevotella xylaniphila TaxID=454155 RepID=UPI0026665367|nr:hypothetical protein [Paraprevotella xylaniphila]
MMKKLFYMLSTLAVVYAFMRAGHADMVSQVIYTMPEDIYEDIVDSLRMQGHEPTDDRIADFYIENY